jgi:hypothetical protein
LGGPGLNTRIDGFVPAPTDVMLVGRAVVTDGYFGAMEIPLVEGRDIATTDVAGSESVAVVNQAFARRFWPGVTAVVGRRLDQGDGWARVVGVARDSVLTSLTDAPPPLVYRPFGQVIPDTLTLHVRSRVDPLGLTDVVRRTLAAVHPDLPALDPVLLSDAMTSGTFVQSVGSAVFAAFGLVALLIAATGLFGVMASHVAERRRELAIAIALGASPRRVVATIVAPAAWLLVAGLAAGAALAVAVGLVLGSRMAGTRLDVAILGTGAVVLVAVAAVTALWPAWRAIRIDPMAVLRTQ